MIKRQNVSILGVGGAKIQIKDIHNLFTYVIPQNFPK